MALLLKIELIPATAPDAEPTRPILPSSGVAPEPEDVVVS